MVESFVPDIGRFARGQFVAAPRVGTDLVMMEVSYLDMVRQRVTAQQVFLAHGRVRLYPQQFGFVWPAEMV